MAVRNLDDDWLFCDPRRLEQYRATDSERSSEIEPARRHLDTDTVKAVAGLQGGIYLIGAGFLVGMGTAVLCGSLIMILALSA